MQSLARLRCPDLMKKIRYMFRYIDDLCMINNGSTQNFLAPEQDKNTNNPFWIYPLQVLEIKPEVTRFAKSDPTRGIKAHFMNMHIKINTLEHALDNFQLSKFDKRRNLPFAYTQYIAFCSNRLIHQSYEIAFSQTVPILYFSSNVPNAVREVQIFVATLERNGFRRHRLIESINWFLSTNKFPGVRFNVNTLIDAIR